MNDRELPRFLQEMLDNPPVAGGGVHDYMFDVARNLHAHMTASDIESLLRSKLAHCGRPVPDREIKNAIENSKSFAWVPKGPSANYFKPIAFTSSTATPAAPPKPAKADPEKIEKLLQDDVGVADLWEASPYSFEGPETEHFIDQLFPGDPMLCCGESSSKFNTLPRSLWAGQLQRLSLLVPSPMTALTGVTKEGKESAHALSNTGPRRFLVIEFDFSEYGRDKTTPTQWKPMLQTLKKRGISVQDICANLLLRLSRAIPMTMAVSSGGKSIHGWWYCAGQDEAQVKKFHDYAITIGADPATWRRSQFVRMPDGTREDGNEQPVLYFNPATLPTS